MTSEPTVLSTRIVAPAAEHLLYLYGVVPVGSQAARLLVEGRVPGIEPDESLFAIETEGLVAAVSRVPATTFDEAPLNALLTDLPRLTPYVLRHEESVCALLPSPLVPMTFGAVYRDPRRVADLLRERGSEFRALLDYLSGRQEWGLKVFSDTPRLMNSAAATSEELRRLSAEAAASGPGRAYLITKRRERLLATEAARIAGEMLSAILTRLAGLSAAAVQDEPGPAQPGAEQLALKAAFLVEDAEVGVFRATATDLEEAYAPHGLRLEVSGPWAPYSFVRRGPATRDAGAARA